MRTKVLSRLDRESVAILTFERPTKLNALNFSKPIIEAKAFGKMVPTAALRQGLDDFIAARK
jgi:hypothetical protein